MQIELEVKLLTFGFLEDQEICLLWVDAHADINTPETSPTG